MIRVLHDGSRGDFVYAMASMYYLAKLRDEQVEIYTTNGVIARDMKAITDRELWVSRLVYLEDNDAAAVRPLRPRLPDVDVDYRSFAGLYTMGARNRHICDVHAELAKVPEWSKNATWLTRENDHTGIVFGLGNRRNSDNNQGTPINFREVYQLVCGHAPCSFCGTAEEYEDFSALIDSGDVLWVDGIPGGIAVLASASLYIGTENMWYAIAQGMGIPTATECFRSHHNSTIWERPYRWCGCNEIDLDTYLNLLIVR